MDNDDEDDDSSDDDNGNGEAARAAPRSTKNGASSSGKDNTGLNPVLGSSGRSRGHLSSKGPDWGDNYCLRALRCACELRSHRDERLGTHIAVTAGTLSLAVLGGCMDEWTYVVNGASTYSRPCPYLISYPCLSSHTFARRTIRPLHSRPVSVRVVRVHRSRRAQRSRLFAVVLGPRQRPLAARRPATGAGNGVRKR